MLDMGMVELSLARDVLDMGWDRRRAVSSQSEALGPLASRRPFCLFLLERLGIRVPCENTVHGRTLLSRPSPCTSTREGHAAISRSTSGCNSATLISVFAAKAVPPQPSGHRRP